MFVTWYTCQVWSAISTWARPCVRTAWETWSINVSQSYGLRAGRKVAPRGNDTWAMPVGRIVIELTRGFAGTLAQRPDTPSSMRHMSFDRGAVNLKKCVVRETMRTLPDPARPWQSTEFCNFG